MTGGVRASVACSSRCRRRRDSRAGPLWQLGGGLIGGGLRVPRVLKAELAEGDVQGRATKGGRLGEAMVGGRLGVCEGVSGSVLPASPPPPAAQCVQGAGRRPGGAHAREAMGGMARPAPTCWDRSLKSG